MLPHNLLRSLCFSPFTYPHYFFFYLRRTELAIFDFMNKIFKYKKRDLGVAYFKKLYFFFNRFSIFTFKKY